MTHYICTGGCKAESQSPGACQAETCSKKGQPLTECNCSDNQHLVEGKCGKCGGKTEGYKCDLCGTEAKEHDPKHTCGGDHCLPKCASCNQAEAKCPC